MVKIDRSFVKDIEVDADDAVIVGAVIDLGHSLGRTVVAEGVETLGQLQFLEDHGCHETQGYYFCRPLPADDVFAYLNQ